MRQEVFKCPGTFANNFNTGLKMLRIINYMTVVQLLFVVIAFCDDITAVKQIGIANEAVKRKQIRSEILYDEIDKLIVSGNVQNRDYAEIIKLAENLCVNHPDSNSAMVILETLERWHLANLITKEQYAPFEKRLVAARHDDDSGRKIIGSIASRYEKLKNARQTEKKSYQPLIKSCQDIVSTPQSSRNLKYFALFFLAEVHREIKDDIQAEKFIDQVIEDASKTDFDFSNAYMILSDSYRLKSSLLYDRVGRDAAANVLKDFIDLYAKGLDSIATTYEDIYKIYATHSSHGQETDEEKFVNHTKAKEVLEEFIGKYPDANSERSIQARLTLFYLVLNGVTMSGGFDEKRLELERKLIIENADRAEIIIQDLVKRTEGTRYEQAVKKSLQVLEEYKNPPKYDASKAASEVPLSPLPQKQNTFGYVLLVIHIIVFVLIFLLIVRKSIVRFLNSVFNKK
jgi:tetratricopeptide (TPR) repeat protein